MGKLVALLIPEYYSAGPSCPPGSAIFKFVVRLGPTNSLVFMPVLLQSVYNLFLYDIILYNAPYHFA